jgi:hypothetical protein
MRGSAPANRSKAMLDAPNAKAMVLLYDEPTIPRARPIPQRVKALGKNRFQPTYAGANMGHPSKTIGRGEETKLAKLVLDIQSRWAGLRFTGTESAYSSVLCGASSDSFLCDSLSQGYKPPLPG